MTITRNYHGGGGTLTRKLCNLPKGGGADDRTQCSGRLPVPGGRLPFQRECDTSVHELAWHQLGAGSGAHDTGCQRGLRCGQRGRRGRAHADGGRNAGSHPRQDCHQQQYIGIDTWHGHLLADKLRRKRIRPMVWHRIFVSRYGADQRDRRRPAPQQPAALSRGVHLAADCVALGRGDAA